MTKFVVVGALAAASLPSTAGAAIVINLTQQGTDVVVAASGAFDTTGLVKNFESVSGGQAEINSLVSSIRTGLGGYKRYRGLTGPGGFGGSVGTVSATAATGDVLGIFGNSGIITLPSNYVSGTTIAGSATFADQTIASLGLTPGTYVYESPNDTLTVNIVAGAVPEPTTWAMMLVGFGMVGAASRYRRRSVTVSLA